MVKSYLRSIGVEYKEVDITKDENAYEFLVKEGHRSVPQIYRDKHLMCENGYHGLVRLPVEKLKVY
jgi:glutaredoxin